jgi:aerobic-type carbon monoxide dehydrogenase small subunit (CoxS/CutS family)
MSKHLVSFTLNGRPHDGVAPDNRLLLDYLRETLGLTGTKTACDGGECGACTVLVDGVPRYSCSVLTHSVRSREITTIEGLASSDGTLHPVQQGVVEEQGFQCAYCMSGFVMAAVGFLRKNPDPTREELAHGVSGNLCRCQDYDKILTALERGAELSREVARG